MAEQSESKKEIVRVTLSQQPTANPPAAPETRETVRINLPTRPPANGPLPPRTNLPRTAAKADTPAPVALRPPGPSSTAGSSPAAMPLPVTPHSAPRKETARITVSHDPPARWPVQMKKTQSLIDMPTVAKPSTRLTVSPETRAIIGEIPRPLCWTLLGISAAILIIQIWSYLS